jgi:hypothetical protein
MLFAMGDVFKIGLKDPVDIAKFGAISHMK